MSNKEIENLPLCLLAAAPAMLEALEAVLFAMNNHVRGEDTYTLAKVKAIAAIRLAKGESQ